MSGYPVERTTNYATTVDTLAEAWAFVMERIDAVGPRPRVEIRPVSFHGLQAGLAGDDPDWTEHFEVRVSGMVEEES